MLNQLTIDFFSLIALQRMYLVMALLFETSETFQTFSEPSRNRSLLQSISQKTSQKVPSLCKVCQIPVKSEKYL